MALAAMAAIPANAAGRKINGGLEFPSKFSSYFPHSYRRVGLAAGLSATSI
jgi:hypothetical protein